MEGLINISDELVVLSKDLVKTIEEEDKEFYFKVTGSYVEKNVPASKFKKNIVGLNCSDFREIIKEN